MTQTNIYVIETPDNGVTSAFHTMEEARDEVLKAWVECIPTMYCEHVCGGEIFTVEEQIAADLENLLKYGFIDDYAYIYEIPLIKR